MKGGFMICLNRQLTIGAEAQYGNYGNLIVLEFIE
jgi:hypothetical protein